LAPEGWHEQVKGEVRKHESIRSSPPESVSRYRILKEIGRGGVGIVYEATDPELRRTVAVKVLSQGWTNSGVIWRFFREGEVMARLAHPNIVSVYDVGEHESQPFLVMEFVQGRTLQDLLNQGGEKPRALVEMLEKAARGVAHAHELGIVHRDLKPGNILISIEGRPKVTDFGLAHWDAFSAELTKSGTAVGTPRYMAPEQMEGRTREITPRTDVYALGAILYEILTGRAVVKGGTIGEVFSSALHDEVVPPPTDQQEDLSRSRDRLPEVSRERSGTTVCLREGIRGGLEAIPG